LPRRRWLARMQRCRDTSGQCRVASHLGSVGTRRQGRWRPCTHVTLQRDPRAKRSASLEAQGAEKIVTLQRKGRKLKNKVKAVAKKDTKAADAKVEACNVELEEYRKGLATQQATIKYLPLGGDYSENGAFTPTDQ
jgi:hypothetical protein